MHFLAAVVGFVVGMVAGFTICYVFEGPEGNWFESMTSQSIAGGIAGCIFGGLIGSITSGLNANVGKTTHGLLVAAIFGIAGGIVGGTRMEIVDEILNQLNMSPIFSTMMW